MNSSRPRFAPPICYAHRSGVIAIHEVLMIFIVLFVLFELSRVFNLALTTIDHPEAAAKAGLRPVYGISVDQDEQHMWVHRLRENVVRINLATRDVEQFLPTKGVQFIFVVHSRDESTRLLCDVDGNVVVYSEGEVAKTAKVSPEAELIPCVTDDGSVAVCATSRGQFQGWRRQDSMMHEFAFDLGSHCDIVQIGLNATGRQMFVARRDGVVSFHAIETGKQSGAPLHVAAESVAFAWSPDESQFVVVTKDFQVQLYDTQTRCLIYQCLLDISSRHSERTLAKISPDGRWLAVSPQSLSEVDLWDLEARVPAGKLCGHEGTVRTLHFSQDSNRVFSGSYDGTIREWSLKTCSLLRIIN